MTRVPTLPVLNRVTDCALIPALPVMSSCVGEVTTRPAALDGLPLVDSVVPGSCCAALTAASMLSRPEPCWSAGAPMSVALLVRISLTRAGVGLVPLCVSAYAWMTSAAAPATIGHDSLVPPKASVCVFVGQSLPFGLHAASPP